MRVFAGSAIARYTRKRPQARMRVLRAGGYRGARARTERAPVVTIESNLLRALNHAEVIAAFDGVDVRWCVESAAKSHNVTAGEIAILWLVKGDRARPRARGAGQDDRGRRRGRGAARQDATRG